MAMRMPTKSRKTNFNVLYKQVFWFIEFPGFLEFVRQETVQAQVNSYILTLIHYLSPIIPCQGEKLSLNLLF